MQLLAQLLIGFSLFSAILLIFAHAVQHHEQQQFSSKLAGFFLIASLGLIQGLNLQLLLDPGSSFFSPLYIALLFCIAPSFYFYSRRLLTLEVGFNTGHCLHALPIVISLLFPLKWLIPLAFLIGSGYLLWLARAVYGLRGQRQRFKLELFALAVLFLIAIGVILLGFVWPLINDLNFITAYSILIGLAFFVVLFMFLHFPGFAGEVAEAAQASYAASTLNKVDRKQVLERLEQLMEQDQLYTMENLSLNLLAEQLQLNSHQLSELINSEFKLGFSKYIRRQRIDAAKKLLIAEPEASVLSIALSVGFSTQSNFYTAFREMVGMPPGQYRKQFLQ